MKDYEKLSKEHFNKQAPVYDETNTMYYSKEGKISCQDIFDYLKNRSFEKLLDVGCGTGYLIDMLSKEISAEYYGLDLSTEMLKVANGKNINQATFIEGTSNQLPFDDNTFDVVTCSQSFHHYPYQEKAMKEAYRVLKDGGIYILSDTGIGGIGGFIDNHILFKLMKSGDCHTQNRKGIAKMMKDAGFHVINSRQLSGFVYTVTAEKSNSEQKESSNGYAAKSDNINTRDRQSNNEQLKLSDVQETALIPLAVRANETKGKKARICDEKAVEIIETLGIDTKNLDKLVTHECVVARTILFDQTVKKLLDKYPDAVCINIGCGLDNRFERVDNGGIDWYNVDLPDSIAVRKKVYRETEREHMLVGNVLDTDWMEAIPKDRVTIVVAEGLFMYFSKEEIKTILNNLTDTFDKGFLVVELMLQKMMKEKMHDTVKNTSAKFGWGTDSGKDLLPLDSRLELISEKSFSSQMKKSTLKSKILGTMIGNLNNRLTLYKWK